MDPFDDPMHVSPAALDCLIRAQRALLEAGFRYVDALVEPWPDSLVQMERQGVQVILGPAAVGRLAPLRGLWQEAHAHLGASGCLILVGDLDCRETTIFRFLEAAPGSVAYLDVQGRQFHLRRPRNPFAPVPGLLRKRALRRLLEGGEDPAARERCRTALETHLRENEQTRQFQQQVRHAGASPRPVLTVLLMVLLAAWFAAMCLAGGIPQVARTLQAPPTGLLVRFGASFGPLVAAGQYWRLLTCGLVHIGLLHLVLNLMGLYYFGRPLEFLQGRWRLGVLLVFGVLAGSVASLWRHPLTISAGVSGGLFGLVGAMLAMVIRYHAEIPPHLRAALRQWLLNVLIYNAVFLFVPFIDAAAHVGGFTGGLALGLALSRSPVRRNRPGLASLAGAVACVAALAAGAVYVVRHLSSGAHA